MLGFCSHPFSIGSVRHARLSSPARLQLATRCHAISSTSATKEAESQRKNKTNSKDQQNSSVGKFTIVKKSLLEKGYADDAICERVEQALEKQQSSCGKEYTEMEMKKIESNIIAMGLLFHNSDDVKYLVRQQPLLIEADLMAWSGFAHTLGFSLNQVLNVDPNLIADTKIDDCMYVVEHLTKHCREKKRLGAKIRKTPRLLAMSPEVMQQAEEALKDLGLTSCTVSLILEDRMDIYCEYDRRRQKFVEEVKQALELLRSYNVDPNHILQPIASLLTRPNCAKRIEERLNAFEKLGFEKHEVAQVIQDVPHALAISPADLQRKWSYIVVVLRNGKEGILEYPQFLVQNVPKDIKPAYAYLVSLNEQHRVTGGPKDGKVSLQLLVQEAKQLERDFKYQDFREEYRRGMRVGK